MRKLIIERKLTEFLQDILERKWKEIPKEKWKKFLIQLLNKLCKENWKKCFKEIEKTFEMILKKFMKQIEGNKECFLKNYWNSVYKIRLKVFEKNLEFNLWKEIEINLKK